MQNHTTKKANLKLNIIMGILNAVINTIVPILSFIYVTRKLSVDGFGINQFAYSLVNYFALFAALGIPLYANKKLSQIKDNATEFRKTSSELFLFNLITATIVFIAFVCCIFFLEKTSVNPFIYLIYGFIIFGNTFAVEWFYQSTEQFTYITIRNFFVKSLTLVAFILFITKPNDYILYAVITTFSTLAYALLNFVRFFKSVKPTFKNINIKQHLKPVLYVFIFSFTMSLYLFIDNIMIGFIIKENFEYTVGQYSVATKIPRSIATIISTINIVLIPRLSYHLVKKDEEKVKNILTNSFSILFAWGLSASVGIILLADKIIPLFCSVAYLDAIETTKVIAATIIFIVLIDFIGIQIFYNNGKAWKSIISCFTGAIIHILTSAILIPKYFHLGAGISNLIGIVATLIMQIIIGYKDMNFKKFTWDNFVSLLSAVVMYIGIMILDKYIKLSTLYSLIVLVCIGILIYLFCLLIFNHKYFKIVLKDIISKIFKKIRSN